MPARVDFQLAPLSERRSELQQAEAQQTSLEAQLRARSAVLEALRRTAASPAAIAGEEDEVARLKQARAAAAERRRALRDGVNEAASGLLLGVDESAAVTALDAHLPVALLPVRIETRFTPDRKALDIRLFPDQIHLDAHEPEPTDAERRGGEWYWQQRWPAPADASVADAAWQTLVSRFRPGRARYLTELFRPLNLAAAPAEAPQFPETSNRAASWTRAVRATALPERWVAVGYQQDVEVFRVWSSRVPDTLDAGPTPSAEEAPPPLAADATAPRVHEGLRWAVDLEAARAAGMALRVHDRNLARGHRLATGLTRLVVLGVDWTLTPEEGAKALETLLAGHAGTGDLAFVAPGTPTNNTGTNGSGFSTAPSEQTAAWAPPVTGADPDEAAEAAAGRLAAALGISAQSLAAAPGAGGRHHAAASALIDATWEATAGYYMSELLSPLGSDALAHALRVHAARHLHPAGPLPTIRVGPQPYGILPVIARGYQPTPGDRAEETIFRVGSAFRTLWEPLVSRVPHLARAGEQRDVDALMLDLLQRTPVPWSTFFREMIPPPQWSSSDWLGQLRTFQAPYLYAVMAALGVSNIGAARVQYLVQSKDNHELLVPLVQKGDAGTSYIAEIDGLTRRGRTGRRDLNLRQNSIALLEAMLAFAAGQELDKAGTAIAVSSMSEAERVQVGFRGLGVRTPDLVRVEAAVVDRLPMQFASARELASTLDPATGVQVHERIEQLLSATPLFELSRDHLSPLHSTGRFLSALGVLSGVPAADLEWAFRGVLDLYSTRLDAWWTSLASSRLARQRAANPAGVHLGCFGWVEDLRPDTGAAAESLGYVLAPSLAHATAAAVLRSGRQAHADTGAFDLDVSSRRSRQATALLEGVAAGQSIAALIGYRLERRLREAGLADLTVPLRRIAPLQARDGERDSPVESVAARDVVDGVRLLSIFAGPSAGWSAALATLPLGGRRNALEDVLREVASNYDAVTDVLFAETVYQMAAGNMDRAGAAAAALDRQERPVEPEVLRTPRDGAIVTSRVLVSLRGTAPAPDWPARGVRGLAEPRLDSWLGVVFGAPSDLRVAGRLVRPAAVAGEPDVVRELGEVTALDLGLSPLALALAAQRPGPGGPNELDARVRAALVGRVGDSQPGDQILVDEAAVLFTICAWAARLVSGARAAVPQDFCLAQTNGNAVAGTLDIIELSARVAAVIEAVREANAGMNFVGSTAADLRSALAGVSELAGGLALPSVTPGVADEVAQLTAQVADVAGLLSDRLAKLELLSAQPLDAAEPFARQLELVQLALGAHQPLLPMCSIASPAEVAASVLDREALLAGDATALTAWLHRASLVRPELDALCGLLTHAEANGSNVVADIAVAQLPHRPGARWCELPYGPEGPPLAGTVGLVVVAPGGFDPSNAHAGLFVDAWAEVIPARDHTAGLTFHYDAPGARPPQSILLAVHPSAQPDRWDLDTLLETVAETAALARLRTLSMKEIEGFSGLLPALYLPQNYTRDVPSVSLKVMNTLAVAQGLVTRVASSVAGK